MNCIVNIMFSKIRKQIYIEQSQDNLLKSIAQQTGISEAEIIRTCIDLHIGDVMIATPQVNIAAWSAEKAFIESIKNRPSIPPGRDWKREDLYER
jgi:thymidylate synthase